MKMENLNKTQIVLLTLLTSFVTSIATGIVTVTLLDQAPPGVTQTINKVVEKTIETVVPGENQVTTIVKEVIVKEQDLIANAVEKASKSLVQIKALNEIGEEIPLALGVVVSGDGYIVTDSSRIEGNRNNLIAVYEGSTFDVGVVSEEDEKFVILKIQTSKTTETEEVQVGELTPASLADSDSVRLGQTVVTIEGEKGSSVLVGIVSRLDVGILETEDSEGNTKEEEYLKYVIASVGVDRKSAGGPLLDTNGNVLGVNVVVSQDGEVKSLPINEIKDSLFGLTKTTEVEKEKNIFGMDLTETE